MDSKHAVYVSSCCSHLIKERKMISELIIKLGRSPILWETLIEPYQDIVGIIEKHLRRSQLYLLVLSGKYGSIEPKSGLSYSEIEFDIAQQLKKEIVVIILTDEYMLKSCENPNDLEMNTPKYRKLQAKLTSNGKFVNYVSNISDLKQVVSRTLSSIEQPL